MVLPLLIIFIPFLWGWIVQGIICKFGGGIYYDLFKNKHYLDCKCVLDIGCLGSEEVYSLTVFGTCHLLAFVVLVTISFACWPIAVLIAVLRSIWNSLQ